MGVGLQERELRGRASERATSVRFADAVRWLGDIRRTDADGLMDSTPKEQETRTTLLRWRRGEATGGGWMTIAEQSVRERPERIGSRRRAAPPPLGRCKHTNEKQLAIAIVGRSIGRGRGRRAERAHHSPQALARLLARSLARSEFNRCEQTDRQTLCSFHSELNSSPIASFARASAGRTYAHAPDATAVAT